MEEERAVRDIDTFFEIFSRIQSHEELEATVKAMLLRQGKVGVLYREALDSGDVTPMEALLMAAYVEPAFLKGNGVIKNYGAAELRREALKDCVEIYQFILDLHARATQETGALSDVITEALEKLSSAEEDENNYPGILAEAQEQIVIVSKALEALALEGSGFDDGMYPASLG